MALSVVRPAQERRPGAFQGDHVGGGQDRTLPVRPAGGRPEQAGGGDDIGIGGAPVPGAAGVAVRDPQGVERRAEGIVVAFLVSGAGYPGRDSS